MPSGSLNNKFSGIENNFSCAAVLIDQYHMNSTCCKTCQEEIIFSGTQMS